MLTQSKIKEELKPVFKQLRTPTIMHCYEEEANRARSESWTYEAYLHQVLSLESETRTTNRIVGLLKASRLPLEKTLDTFDLNRLPLKLRQQVKVLTDGSFLDRRENVLAFGNPGSGKTHLVCAIGHELINQGRKVLFKSCNMLVQELLIAKRDLLLKKFLKRLSAYDVLIIDDLGYVQQSREEMEVLFTLLAQRYERGSIMLTSNLPFSKWEQIFKDPMTTAAAIDRLVHHSLILEMNLKSYRLEAAKKQKTQE